MKGHSDTQELCPERDVAVFKRDESQDGEVCTETESAASECETAEDDKMYGPFDTVSDLMKALNA